MTEATGIKDPPAVEPFLPDEEIEKFAADFLKEGKGILFSWHEFQAAVASVYLDAKRSGSNVTREHPRFQRGKKWFDVAATQEELEVVMADNEADLDEDTRSDPDNQKRLRSRQIMVEHGTKSFRDQTPTGTIFYMGPDQPARTGTYVMPANTRTVSQRIETFLSEMKSL